MKSSNNRLGLLAWGRPRSYDFSRQGHPYYPFTIAVSVLVSASSMVFQYKTPTRSHTSHDQSMMHYDDMRVQPPLPIYQEQSCLKSVQVELGVSQA